MINYRVRIKNPVFWVNIALSIIAPIGVYFGITAQDLTTWTMLWDTLVKAVSNPYVVFTIVVSMWNAINDPTTAGIKDSKQALSYDSPRKDTN